MGQNEDPCVAADRLDTAASELRASTDDLLLAGLQRAAEVAVERELAQVAGFPATRGLTKSNFQVRVTRLPAS